MSDIIPRQADREIAAELHDEMGMYELAQAVRAGRMDGDSDVQRAARHRLAAERETIERIAAAIEQVKRDFLSEEYAYPQPVGSIQERFACDQCLYAIRATSSKDTIDAE